MTMNQQEKERDKSIDWTPCTEERYYDMLGVLPPAAQGNHGSFLVGEPMNHRDGRPTFSAFKHVGNRYYTATAPLTFKEFKAEFPAAEYYYC